MKRNQQSIIFWIIFLVIVACFALLFFPRYGILAKDFRATQLQNLAANLTSSSAANYTQKKYNPEKGVEIKNCKDVTKIAGINLPPGYQIKDQNIPSDKVALCTLSAPGVANVTFSVVGVSK